MDEIISNLDVNKLVKDQLVSKSMETWRLDNSKQLLSEAIHHSAVVVSETGEEIQKVPVESTSDTTISSAQSDSDSDEPLVIIAVLLQCGSSSFKFKSFSIKFRIWNNSSSSDVLYIQASISISPKYESK